MPPDTALTWDDLRTAHDHFARVAVQLFNSEGEVAPQVFLVEGVQNGAVTGFAALPPQQMAAFFRSESGKDAFASFLREIFDPASLMRQSVARALGFAPVLLVQVNEAWVSMASPESLEAARRGRIRPSRDPQRREAVLVMVHSRVGSVPVVHPVHDEPSRHAQQAPFPKDGDGWSFEGRFALQSDERRAGPTH